LDWQFDWVRRGLRLRNRRWSAGWEATGWSSVTRATNVPRATSGRIGGGNRSTAFASSARNDVGW